MRGSSPTRTYVSVIQHTLTANMNISQDAKKYYQRLGAEATQQTWTTEMVEEVDIFEGGDVEDDEWDNWD